MIRKTVITSVLALALIAVAIPPLLRAAEAKPKYTIKEVMKALHKGKENVSKRVLQGQGTKDDLAKLVEYYASLPLCTPEKGDKASWTAKTSLLLKSAQSLKAGDPASLAAYKQAVNCKACHSLHKPD